MGKAEEASVQIKFLEVSKALVVMLMPTAWHAIGIHCCALRLKFMGEYFSAGGKP